MELVIQWLMFVCGEGGPVEIVPLPTEVEET
jgi:hypothetical protein